MCVCVCECVCLYMCVYMYMYMCVCVYMYMYIHLAGFQLSSIVVAVHQIFLSVAAIKNGQKFHTNQHAHKGTQSTHPCCSLALREVGVEGLSLRGGSL